MNGSFTPLRLRRIVERLEPQSPPSLVDAAPSDDADEMRAVDGDEGAHQQPTASCGCDQRRVECTMDDVRTLAVRLAADACARALGHAVAKNPLFVVRFVNAAIAAAGWPQRAVARLCEHDAEVCRGFLAIDTRPDSTLGPGDVILETDGGSVRATLAERAHLLVRSAADL